jgi:hypothetical protein
MLLHIRSLAGYTIVMLESSFWKRQVAERMHDAVRIHWMFGAFGRQGPIQVEEVARLVVLEKRSHLRAEHLVDVIGPQRRLFGRLGRASPD